MQKSSLLRVKTVIAGTENEFDLGWEYYMQTASLFWANQNTGDVHALYFWSI